VVLEILAVERKPSYENLLLRIAGFIGLDSFFYV
jgi:hypothetical protein